MRQCVSVKMQRVFVEAGAKTGIQPILPLACLTIRLNMNASRISLAQTLPCCFLCGGNHQPKQTDQENVILKIRDTPRTGSTCHGTNVCWKLEKDMPTTSTCARYGLSVKVNKYMVRRLQNKIVMDLISHA